MIWLRWWQLLRWCQNPWSKKGSIYLHGKATNLFVPKMVLKLIYLFSWCTDSRISVEWVSRDINQPDLQNLIITFLSQCVDHNSIFFDYMQTLTGTTSTLPHFNQPITIFPSTVAIFYAPSDICGTGGMWAEHICAIPTWQEGPGCYDCVLIWHNCGPLDSDTDGL